MLAPETTPLRLAAQVKRGSFGGWKPHLILLGSFFFAGVEILALRVQITAIGLPHQFLRMLPYLATILVMTLAFREARPPAFLGQNYDRESRTTSS